MKNYSKAAFAATLVGLATTATPAAASVMAGDSLTCTQSNPFSNFVCAPVFATVGMGPEFTVGNSRDFLSFDFSTNSLVMTALVDTRLSRTFLSFANLGNPFTSATLTNTSGITGFNGGDGLTQGDVSIGGGDFILNLTDTSLEQGATATFTFGGAMSAVPEPGTWAMMILGFFGLGLAMRSEKAAKMRVSYS